MPRASASATTMIRTSSSSELDADDLLSESLFRVVFTGGLCVALGGGGLLGGRSLNGGRLLGLGGSPGVGGGRRLRVGGLLDRLLVDRLARHLLVGRGGRLGGGVVQQPGLDDLLRARVAA